MKRKLFTAAFSAAIILMSAQNGFCADKIAIEPLKQNERIVFFGDSITHGGECHMHVLLVQALRHQGSNVIIYNGGISGGTAGDGFARIDYDILAKRPDRVFIMFGMNDVGITHYNGKDDEKTKAIRAKCLANYKSNMIKCIEKIMAAGKKVVLVTPTPYDEYTPHFKAKRLIGANEEGLAGCARIVRELAATYKLPYVEFFEPQTAIIKKQQGIFGRDDRVHPNSVGHCVMAAMLLGAIGEKPLKMRAEVNAATGSHKAENVKIENVETVPSGVSFKYTPAALPFPMNKNMEKAEAIYPVATAFNNEELTVTSLAKGAYEITAGNHILGTFTNEQLAAGINMASLKTPVLLAASKTAEIKDKIYRLNSQLRGIVMMRRTANAKGKCATMEAEFAALDAFLQEPSIKKNKYYHNMVESYKKDRPNEDALIKELEGLYPKLYASAKTFGFDVVIKKMK